MDSLSPELQQIARRAQRGGILAYQKARVTWDKSQATAVLVEQATSAEPCFPSTTELAKLAAITHDAPGEVPKIMEVLLRRLDLTEAKKAPAKNWRKTLKALQVAYYLLTHGSDAAVEAITEHVFTLARLEDSFYTSSLSPDKLRADNAEARDAHEGAKLVRAKARATLDLLRDPARLASARAEARQKAGTYIGFSSADSAFHAPPPPRGTSGGGSDAYLPPRAPDVVVSTAGRAPVRSFSLGGTSLGMASSLPQRSISTTPSAPPALQPPPSSRTDSSSVAAVAAAPLDIFASLTQEGAPSEWAATTWQEFVSGPPPGAAAGTMSLQNTTTAGVPAAPRDPFEGLLLEMDGEHGVGGGVFVESAKAAAVASAPMLPDVATAWSPPSPVRTSAQATVAQHQQPPSSQPFPLSLLDL